MIEAEKRKAIFVMHQEGLSEYELARLFHVSRNTVREIVGRQGEMPKSVRSDKIHIDEELLRRLHADCDGYAQRVYEKLVEEEGIEVKYSTVTRMLRELGIGVPSQQRCDEVPDRPGAEMQHDTSSYDVKIGQALIRVIASLIYLRYSKRRYLKFYRAFNRFKMKCFFHEALMFWQYAAPICVIDNTNLARLKGIGKNAVMVPEMAAFGKQYGFEFICHERGHANRKAGEEKGLHTAETNFLPGRTFRSLEDMNAQAFDWATDRMHTKPLGKTRVIPAEAFEHERPYLVKLSPHLPAPYLIHERRTDQYGYAALGGNYYWVPGVKRDDVKVIEYAEGLKIYQNRECIAEYSLPQDGVRNEKFSPQGLPLPRYKPSHRKKPTQEEEQRLGAMDQAVNAYLDFVLPPLGVKRHGFLRKLFALCRKMTPELFIKSIERAHKYKITGIETIERIALLQMRQETATLPLVEVDEDFRERDAYQEGYLTDRPDLSVYENNSEEEDDG
jgi:transposase